MIIIMKKRLFFSSDGFFTIDEVGTKPRPVQPGDTSASVVPITQKYDFLYGKFRPFVKGDDSLGPPVGHGTPENGKLDPYYSLSISLGIRKWEWD